MNGKQNAVRRSAIVISLVFLAELAGGFYSGSLALLSDAGHMFVDTAALWAAFFSIRLSEKKPTRLFTFGHKNIEATTGIVSATMLVCFILFYVLVDVMRRFMNPTDHISTPVMFVVGAIGLVANIYSAYNLYPHAKSDLAVRGAFWQNKSDLYLSIAVIAGALLIMMTGNSLWDPIVTVGMAAWIIYHATREVYGDGITILHAGVPEDVDLEEVKNAIESIRGVREVLDLHLVGMGTNFTKLEGHILVAQGMKFKRAQEIMLKVKEAVKGYCSHSTIQIETRRTICQMHCSS